MEIELINLTVQFEFRELWRSCILTLMGCYSILSSGQKCFYVFFLMATISARHGRKHIMQACNYTEDTASQLGMADDMQHTQEQVSETADYHKKYFCKP